MKKHKEFYYTTRKFDHGYEWRIRNIEGEILESSLYEYFTTKREAELDAIDRINHYWLC